MENRNLVLRQVKLKEKEILRNLLEKYDYEFSKYDQRDVNSLGLYGYEYLDHYWTEENRWAFFILVEGKLAGFVMINNYPDVTSDTDYSMAEFFVMHKYRRGGVGRFAALEVLNRFRGKWQVKRHPNNQDSVRFWNKIIDEYTKGSYELFENHPEAEYDDGTFGDVFLFDNSMQESEPSTQNFIK